MKSLAYHAAKLAIRPKGPLEEAIFEHMWQAVPIETVLVPLMQAEVFLYVQASEGPDPKPLAISGEGGKPVMLVFTSQERAASVAKQLPPGAPAPLRQAFKEVLRWAPIELGLFINHGSALWAECASSHMDALRKQAGIFRP
jgi:SseB protein N-terminal domain